VVLGVLKRDNVQELLKVLNYLKVLVKLVGMYQMKKMVEHVGQKMDIGKLKKMVRKDTLGLNGNPITVEQAHAQNQKPNNQANTTSNYTTPIIPPLVVKTTIGIGLLLYSSPAY
jgi:hypothetical protein